MSIASSSSSIVAPQKNGVFLSFRGTDTGTFVSRLHVALGQQNIPFVGGEDFQKGRAFSEMLDKIQESTVLVVILSTNYADSPWCLEELVEIMECRKIEGQQVVRIFYHVDPSHVENPTGSYGVALEKHKADENITAETLECWKNALVEVAKLPEHVLVDNSSEEQAIEDIVNDISVKLGPPSFEFDVFLNSRGHDTRSSFLSHLFAALKEKGIETFYDADDLTKGEETDKILEKIKVSKMSIMIFSKDYASSSYCLDELLTILECKKRWGHKALPVFYLVPPDVVAEQSESYAEAFQIHEERGTDSEKLLAWRASLAEAAGLSGQVLENKRPEGFDIQEIVEDVKKKLTRGKALSSVRRRASAVKRETIASSAGPRASAVRRETTSSSARPRASTRISADWAFMLTNIVLEMLVLTFDQLSSPHKPQYARAVMILSLGAMLVCFAEFVYKGKKQNVTLQWQGWRFRLHSPSSNEEPCYSYIDYASFLGTVCQFIFSVIGYTHMCGGKESPINISVTAIFFLVFFAVSKCCKDRKEKPRLPVAQPHQDDSLAIDGVNTWRLSVAEMEV